jgi:hypothetical protein
MAKRRSIGRELHIGEIDDDELVIVLNSILPRSARFRPDEVEYRTMSDDSVLTLKYHDGKIIDAEVWPSMTSDFEREILEATEAALAHGDTAVYRWPMFSGRSVEGTWRYHDNFQIAPAPPEAPRPGELWAEHPFLVDFVFEKSSNQRIEQHRYARKATDLLLVLNLLLNTRITGGSPSL